MKSNKFDSIVSNIESKTRKYFQKEKPMPDFKLMNDSDYVESFSFDFEKFKDLKKLNLNYNKEFNGDYDYLRSSVIDLHTMLHHVD